MPLKPYAWLFKLQNWAFRSFKTRSLRACVWPFQVGSKPKGSSLPKIKDTPSVKILAYSSASSKVQRDPNPQPNLHSPVQAGSNGGRPQRGGTNLGVFVPVWPVIAPGILMTGHIGTNTPKSVSARWGRLPFDPAQTGLCKFGCGFGAR